MIKKKILEDKTLFKNLEKIIHPLVRKEMIRFAEKHKNKKFIFFEIPLLVESRLMKKFDKIFFIKANRSLRLKRFKKRVVTKFSLIYLMKNNLVIKRKQSIVIM